VCGVLVSAGIGNILAGIGGATCTYLALSAFGAPRGCTRASSPRAWARSRRSGRALRLVLYAPSPSLRRTEGEVSVTPIERVANYGFLVELLSGDSSGLPCPIR
jgi:hypothetical protein